MPNPEPSKPEPGKTGRDPIVVDLGKKSPKLIKRLRKGKGKLMDQLNDCINELKTSGTIAGTVQPVVVIVRERATLSRMSFGKFF